jgi:homoserine O-succinyltransferase
MPLQIEGGRIPPRWAERITANPKPSPRPKSAPLRIAFINNMPDSALEDTEMQFLELLEGAAGDIPLRVKFYSLPKVPRAERGLLHLSDFYHGLEDLWTSRFDALIMTGTEPLQSDLRQEPYWHALTDVLSWAERNTHSTILSCLAAHAGVLHSDNVPRHPLPDKQFGVFDSACVQNQDRPNQDHPHELTRNAAPLRFPHSRWNEVRPDALVAAGYTILTQSPQAGVDLFVKQKEKSLFLYIQGHPEYGPLTLLKEYRRDIKRFLRQERKTYPTMPQGYFDRASTKLLAEFRDSCLADPREEQLADFPEALLLKSLENTWQSSAITLYRNWINLIASRKRKEETAKFSDTTLAENRREAAATGKQI